MWSIKQAFLQWNSATVIDQKAQVILQPANNLSIFKAEREW